MNHSRYCNNIGSISSYCNNNNNLIRDHHHPIVRRTVPNILDEPDLYQIEEMYSRPTSVLIMLNHDVDGRWIVKTQDVDNNVNQHQVQENHDNNDATLLQGANHQESLPREDDQENNDTVQAVQQPSTALL